MGRLDSILVLTVVASGESHRSHPTGSSVGSEIQRSLRVDWVKNLGTVDIDVPPVPVDMVQPNLKQATRQILVDI